MISSPKLLWRVLVLFRPYRARMAAGVLLAALTSLAGMGLLGISGWFLATMGLAGVAGITVNYFTPAAVIRGAAIVRTGGRYAERLVNHDVTLRALSDIRVWLFSRLLPLAPAGTGFLGNAEMFGRLRADVDRLEHAYLAVVLPVAVALLTLPVVTAVLAFYVWQVALISVLAILLVAVALPWHLSRRSMAASVVMLDLESQMRTATSDALLGAAELKVFGAEEAQAQRIARLTEAHGRQRRHLEQWQALGSGSVTLVSQLTVAGSLLLAAHALQQHALTPAGLAMIVLLTLAQFEVVSTLPEAISKLDATLVSAARVFALIDTQPAVIEPEVAAAAPVCRDIRFTNVNMRYTPEGPWALKGLNLHLPAGHRIAIVGPSGAGKSSLINALLCFYPIQAGNIEIGHRPIYGYAGDTVRGLISVVEQRTHIFNASLLDNLMVARPDATTAQIHAALAAAQLDRFVADAPEGLETWLGEGGVLLSGGEARRVAIARALLADRPIVILDEPTEGLDARTANGLLHALGTLMEGRSVILITHRLEGLASLIDERLTLHDGRIDYTG